MKQMRWRPLSGAMALAGALLTLATAQAADWPQWRGPDRNGIATDQPRLARAWPAGGPPQLWKTESIGAGDSYGYSTPVVANGRVYLFVPTTGLDMIYCFSESNGATLWRKDYPATTGHGEGSSSSVCVTNGRVYVGGTDSKAYCLDATNGAPIWTVDLSNRWLRQQELHGSFLVVDGVAVIQGGQHDGTDAPYGGVAALNAETGEVLWSRPKYGSEGSPVAWRKDGKTYILTVAADGISCMDLVTGRMMWNATPGGTCHTLTVSGDYAVFNSDGYPNRGLVCFSLATNKAEVVWQLRNRTYDGGSAVVIYNGYVYVANSNSGEIGGGKGTVLCADLVTGSVAWEKPFKNLSYFCPVIADGKFFVTEDYGSRLVMVDANPGQYRVLGGADVSPYMYVSPVIANGKLFSRRSDGIHCYDLTEKANNAPTIATAATCAPNPVPLPHSAALSVTANDQDNDPLTYAWSKASGPGTVVFTPNGTNTETSCTANFSAAGNYVLRVVAADDRGGSVTSEVAVTVQTPGLVTSATNVTVPEGGTATFGIKLADMPAGNVVVGVMRTAGDTNVTVSGGASLTFTTNNWDVLQTVTLSGAHDSDATNDVATIVCSASGLNSAMVIVTKAEDDAVLTVEANPIPYYQTGTTTPTGATVVVKGVDTSITAAPKTGYTFVKWIVTKGAATIADANATSTTVRITSDATVQAYFGANSVSVSVDGRRFVVPEGGMTSTRIGLSAPPTGVVTVTVARTEGDTDLSVYSGGTLVFTPENWNICQTVILAAAQDADTTNGTATFTCSAPGVTAATLSPSEFDDDTSLTVQAMTGGTVTPAGTMDMTKGSTIGINAIPNAGYTFVNWRVIAGEATIANAAASNTTVTVRDTATVCANFSSRPGNRAPTIVTPAYASPNPITAPWPTTVRVSATDPDGDPLTYTWGKVSGRGAVSFTPNGTTNSATSTATFDEGSSYVLRVTVSDGDGGMVSSDMTVVVNPKPEIITAGGSSVPEGGTATLQVYLNGSQPSGNVTATVARTAGDVDITVQSGATLVFTPSNYTTWQNVILAAAKDDDTTNGTATITISAPGLTSRILNTMEVDSGPNSQAPTISSVAVLYGTVGAPYCYKVATTGSPLPSVTVSGLPGWLNKSGNTLSGTPSLSGTYGPITVTASNGINPVATQSYSIMVTGMESNEWSQWRGPNRDGKSAETLNVESWPPPVLWSNKIANAESSVVVSEGRLYTMGRLGNTNLVYCFDAGTGSNVWTQTYPTANYGIYGPLATPTVCGNEVYTFDDAGKLSCWHKVTGSNLWNTTVDLSSPQYGYASSPLVEGDLIFLNASGIGAAVSRTTHAVVWPTESPPAGSTYASPVGLTVNGQRMILIQSVGALKAVDPASGTVLWSYPYSGANYYAADPVVYGDKILLHEQGLVLLQAGTNSVSKVWSFPWSTGAAFSTPVVIGDYAYAADDGGYLVRIDLAKGNVGWPLPISSDYFPYQGVLTAVNDKLVIMADGKLRVVKIGLSGFDEEGRAPVQVSLTDSPDVYGWTPPVVSNGRIYCRIGETLVCYQTGLPDSNHNGIPDAWEQAYFGTTDCSANADADGDGFSNLAEYVAGTVPTNAASLCQLSVTRTNGNLIVSCPTVKAEGVGYSFQTRYYTLETSTNLLDSSGWTAVAGYESRPADNTVLSYTNNCAENRRFFRLHIELRR